MSATSNDQTLALETLARGLPSDIAGMLDQWLARRTEWAGPLRIDSPGEIATLIDHTLLKPTATPQDVRTLCAEAAAWHFKSVCVNPCHVPLVSAMLDGSGVLCCTVVGFPLGATTSGTKAAETREAVESGADEIDMVINQGNALDGEWKSLTADIAAVVDAAAGRTVKVIIETCNMNRVSMIGACVCSALAHADFVKTSTGFGSAGADADDIALMRLVVGGGMSVKASGGIRSTADALKMIAAGADRIGASASIAIIGAPL